MYQRILRAIEKTIKLLFKALIYLYRWTLSPILGPRCRFYPTCSEYALNAFSKHSLPKALLLVTKRLLKCHPFGRSGYDPVPDKQLEEKE